MATLFAAAQFVGGVREDIEEILERDASFHQLAQNPVEQFTNLLDTYDSQGKQIAGVSVGLGGASGLEERIVIHYSYGATDAQKQYAFSSHGSFERSLSIGARGTKRFLQHRGETELNRERQINQQAVYAALINPIKEELAAKGKTQLNLDDLMPLLTRVQKEYLAPAPAKRPADEFSFDFSGVLDYVKRFNEVTDSFNPTSWTPAQSVPLREEAGNHIFALSSAYSMLVSNGKQNSLDAQKIRDVVGVLALNLAVIVTRNLDYTDKIYSDMLSSKPVDFDEFTRNTDHVFGPDNFGSLNPDIYQGMHPDLREVLLQKGVSQSVYRSALFLETYKQKVKDRQPNADFSNTQQDPPSRWVNVTVSSSNSDSSDKVQQARNPALVFYSHQESNPEGFARAPPSSKMNSASHTSNSAEVPQFSYHKRTLPDSLKFKDYQIKRTDVVSLTEPQTLEYIQSGTIGSRSLKNASSSLPSTIVEVPAFTQFARTVDSSIDSKITREDLGLKSSEENIRYITNGNEQPLHLVEPIATESEPAKVRAYSNSTTSQSSSRFGRFISRAKYIARSYVVPAIKLAATSALR